MNKIRDKETLVICDQRDVCHHADECSGAIPFKWDKRDKCFLISYAQIIDLTNYLQHRYAKHGYEKGELCNRPGCYGTITKAERQSCTCHMGNPPCSSCTIPLEECIECGWTAYDEFGAA